VNEGRKRHTRLFRSPCQRGHFAVGHESHYAVGADPCSRQLWAPHAGAFLILQRIFIGHEILGDCIGFCSESLEIGVQDK
jgi:hypothetical protein